MGFAATMVVGSLLLVLIVGVVLGWRSRQRAHELAGGTRFERFAAAPPDDGHTGAVTRPDETMDTSSGETSSGETSSGATPRDGGPPLHTDTTQR